MRNNQTFDSSRQSNQATSSKTNRSRSPSKLSLKSILPSLSPRGYFTELLKRVNINDRSGKDYNDNDSDISFASNSNNSSYFLNTNSKSSNGKKSFTAYIQKSNSVSNVLNEKSFTS